MKINSVWECAPSNKTFFVDVVLDSGEMVRPMVEVEYTGAAQVVHIEFIGNDGELPDRLIDDIIDYIKDVIDWDTFFSLRFGVSEFIRASKLYKKNNEQ